MLKDSSLNSLENCCYAPFNTSGSIKYLNIVTVKLEIAHRCGKKYFIGGDECCEVQYNKSSKMKQITPYKGSKTIAYTFIGKKVNYQIYDE